MKIERKRAPRPRTQAKTEPITTSSGRARSPSNRHPRRDGDRRGEEAEPDVDPGRRGREGSGEGDVAERVAGEDLAAQDHEVADQPAGKRDGGAGEEGVAHELVGEHQAGSPTGKVIAATVDRRAGTAALRRRGRSERLVTQKPTG